MTAQRDSFDISDLSELARAVEAARAAGKRLTIVRNGEEVAEIVPQRRRTRQKAVSAETEIDLTEVLKGMSPESVVMRTAGALRRYRRFPPLTVRKEKEAFAQAVADENSRVDSE